MVEYAVELYKECLCGVCMMVYVVMAFVCRVVEDCVFHTHTPHLHTCNTCTHTHTHTHTHTV